MSYHEKGGRTGGEHGAPEIEELGSGSFNTDGVTPTKANTKPLFEPGQLDAYANTPYELIRLHSPNDKDQRGRSIGKAPLSKGWRYCDALTVSEAKDAMAAGHNIGVRLREIDLVIDVDHRNYVDGDDPLKRLQEDMGFSIDDYPVVITGSGGLHIYMQMPAGNALRDTHEKYQGIEFKSQGRQVVAPGSVHPDTMGTYRCSDDPLAVSIDEMRNAPLKLIELAKRPATLFDESEGGEYTPEQLERLLNGVDVLKFADHDAWLGMMMSCHHATGGEGRQEFIAWSIGDARYSDDDAIIGRRWDSLDPNAKGYTKGTLLKAVHDEDNGHLIPRDKASDDFADDLDEQTDTEQENPVSALVAKMNERYCAAFDGGDYSIYMTDLDDLYEPPRTVLTRLSRTAFRHYYVNEVVSLPDQTIKKSIADVWLHHPDMRKYRGIVLDPSGRETDKLNLWQGWAVDPLAGDWSLMRELIEDVLCAGNRDCSDYVIRWMAFMVQKPAIRPEVAIAFRGNEGTGKSTLGRALMRLAGRHGITVSSPKQLAGNFNAHLRSAVFVFADEALWPGNKEAEGTLKQLVTEPLISFEPKGKDTVMGRNLVHLMLASNEEWIVPAGKDARRFLVLDVADTYRNDRQFFGRLNRQMENGGYEAMLHDLLEMDLGDWHPAQNVPQTQALADQKLMSLDPATKFWMEKLESGEIGFIEKADWLAGPLELTDERDMLRSEYDAYLKRNRIYSVKATHKSLAAAGKSLGLEAVKLKSNSVRGWTLPPLDEARALFDNRIGASDLFD